MSSIEDYFDQSGHPQDLTEVSGFLVGAGISLSGIYHPEHMPFLCSLISLGIAGIYADARAQIGFSPEDAAHGIRRFLISMLVSEALVTSTNYFTS